MTFFSGRRLYNFVRDSLCHVRPFDTLVSAFYCTNDYFFNRAVFSVRRSLTDCFFSEYAASSLAS
jgi:hypothetical protein